ncbi:MAG TPA: ABC transporter permease [Candidatus Excrementavichristensenella intestinipullorum]|nr:ABC transporter permease [Candidatus Excrementavichristensenella intestinipullorum]
MFDRFQASGGGEALTDDLWNARVIRYGDDLITVGIAVLLTALLVLFYQFLVTKLGLPRLIIGLFFLLLCVLGTVYDLSLPTLLSNSVVRMGMNSILVLAMVPGIQCGISLNLGLPLGIVGGLLGGLLCIELGYSGWGGFLFAIAVGILIAMVVGYLYGLLLNRLKGSEMAVTTYVGYSIVSLMCIAWMLLPFKSTVLRWPLGPGLRATLRLDSSYKHILNNLWSFEIGGFTVATGLLLFMALCCLLMWLFLRSKTGVAMSAAGNNPRFAEATGINVDKMRIIGTVLSTILGAVGIIVYSQSYGFMQLYTAPRQMGFIAASAILIGGASTSRCRISHVIIGTFLFQGVLTLGMPVANVLVPQSTISETLRILISNGIILYALTKSGGVSRA